MKTARNPAAPRTGPAVSHAPLEVPEITGTRQRLVRAILHAGPSTAAHLSEQLEITPAAVRRHLEALLADGLIEARPERIFGARGRGRPAKVFALTDLGRDTLEQAYDDLALQALRYLGEIGGPEMVHAFARRRVADFEHRYGDAVQAAEGPEGRVGALAEALTADGYAASAHASPVTDGDQICQFHCPVAHVAEEFPELCEAETEAFSRLLGTHVQRIATIAHGDGVCTTHVPRVSSHQADTTTPSALAHSTADERTTP